MEIGFIGRHDSLCWLGIGASFQLIRSIILKSEAIHEGMVRVDVFEHSVCEIMRILGHRL